MAKRAQAAQKKSETATSPEATSGRQPKEAPELTAAQQKAVAKLDTVSGKIRYLDSEGYERADIARILNKRYQHVRNVLVTPVKKAQKS